MFFSFDLPFFDSLLMLPPQEESRGNGGEKSQVSLFLFLSLRLVCVFQAFLHMSPVFFFFLCGNNICDVCVCLSLVTRIIIFFYIRQQTIVFEFNSRATAKTLLILCVLITVSDDYEIICN